MGCVRPSTGKENLVGKEAAACRCETLMKDPDSADLAGMEFFHTFALLFSDAQKAAVAKITSGLLEDVATTRTN